MKKTLGSHISEDVPITSMAIVLIVFAIFQLQHRSVFPDNWFPSQFAISSFMILFCVWILSEIINTLFSRKNSQTTNKDKGSCGVIIAVFWSVLFIAFTLRSFGIGIFGGSLQYTGLILLAIGTILREWSIWALGKHFTGQVQVREKAKLVTNGPYNYIRHPSYTGGMLSLIGIPLAIGTWLGVLIAFIFSLIAYQYRIRVEEETLQEAFGSEYEEYKNRTYKLFPGF
jgi:protein-S-isoprenylcysteine O-methyltransferase Ste14